MITFIVGVVVGFVACKYKDVIVEKAQEIIDAIKRQ